MPTKKIYKDKHYLEGWVQYYVLVETILKQNSLNRLILKKKGEHLTNLINYKISPHIIFKEESHIIEKVYANNFFQDYLILAQEALWTIAPPSEVHLNQMSYLEKLQEDSSQILKDIEKTLLYEKENTCNAVVENLIHPLDTRESFLIALKEDIHD